MTPEEAYKIHAAEMDADTDTEISQINSTKKAGDASMSQPREGNGTLTPGAERSNPSPAPTDLDLQLFLVKQLPEEIVFNELTKAGPFYWRNIFEDSAGHRRARVIPREWDYIVRRVEEKLSDQEKCYPFPGGEEWYSERDNYFSTLEELITPTTYEEDIYFSMVKASWQNRAIALMNVLS